MSGRSYRTFVLLLSLCSLGLSHAEEASEHSIVLTEKSLPEATVPRSFTDKLYDQYFGPNSPDPSCRFYLKRNKVSSIPPLLGKYLTRRFIAQLCDPDKLPLLSTSPLPKRGSAEDSLVKIARAPMLDGSPFAQFKTSYALIDKTQKLAPESVYKNALQAIKNHHKKLKTLKNEVSGKDDRILALTYSILAPLLVDETDGYVLEPKHTSSPSKLEFESGLAHISPNSIYADNSAVPANSHPLKNLLLKHLSKINEILKNPDKEKATAELVKHCDLDHFNQDYFDFISDVARTKKGLNYIRDYSPKVIYQKLKSDLGQFNRGVATETLLKDAIAGKKRISEKILLNAASQSDGDRFNTTFRTLQYYCPKLTIDYASISIRLNANHQGAISRQEFTPHCLDYFLNLAANKEVVCKDESL